MDEERGFVLLTTTTGFVRVDLADDDVAVERVLVVPGHHEGAHLGIAPAIAGLVGVEACLITIAGAEEVDGVAERSFVASFFAPWSSEFIFREVILHAGEDFLAFLPDVFRISLGRISAGVVGANREMVGLSFLPLHLGKVMMLSEAGAHQGEGDGGDQGPVNFHRLRIYRGGWDLAIIRLRNAVLGGVENLGLRGQKNSI